MMAGKPRRRSQRQGLGAGGKSEAMRLGVGEPANCAGSPTVAHLSDREGRLAGSTGLEPAASAVTGQRSNQLNYDPDFLSAFALSRSGATTFA